MGQICSRVSAVDKSPSDTALGPDPRLTRGPQEKAKETEEEEEPSVNKDAIKQLLDPLPPLPEAVSRDGSTEPVAASTEPGEPRLSRASSQKSGIAKPKISVAKVAEVSSMLSKASTVGLGKAVEALDSIGSSITSLNRGGGFVSGTASKSNKISILAFEVANTIVKGSNLMRSLSKESIKHLKEVVLHSEGVQHLVSRDMDELVRIAAADKRDELQVFSKEVIRFGNRCKDPQWHVLDRYFDELAREHTPHIYLKEEAELMMQQLMVHVQCTAELYHELHALDRFDQDFRRKQQEEESSNANQKGDNLQILKQEVKSQKKHVKNLKKKSLWSKNLEEIMEKLVDIVHFLHLEIYDAFGSADEQEFPGPGKDSRRLGPAGLALHYANIITQLDTIVSRSSSVPPNSRDTLYQGLPLSVKSTLRSRLQAFELKEELNASQIKAEMEKTLRWLVPIANNTTKVHHGFGWVGEWANTGSEVGSKSTSGSADLLRIETLHHAEKEKVDAYILDLVVWLHLLINQSKAANGGRSSPIKSPVRSPTQQGFTVPSLSSSRSKASSSSPLLTQEDQEMLQGVNFCKFVPGISKSQELDMGSRMSKRGKLIKSNSHSPSSSSKKDFSIRRLSMLPVIDFGIDPMKAMDVIDDLKAM